MRIRDVGPAHEIQRPNVDFFVLSSGDAFVEDHGVGDDGARHATCLRNVGHSEQAGNSSIDDWSCGVHLVKYRRNPVNPLLQRISGCVDRLFGHGHKP